MREEIRYTATLQVYACNVSTTTNRMLYTHTHTYIGFFLQPEKHTQTTTRTAIENHLEHQRRPMQNGQLYQRLDRIHSDGGVGDVENGLVEWERDVIAADWWVQLIYANYIMFKEKNVSEI